MKRSYEIYQPSKLIQDFYAAPAYYRAKDVNWSPFTPVGDLFEQQPIKDVLLLVSPGVKPKRLPVFPAGFSLGANNDAPADKAQYEPNYVAVVWQGVGAFASFLGYTIVGTAKALSAVKLWPKKYTIEHGVQRDFSGRIFTFAKLSVTVLIAVSLIAWGTLHGSSKSGMPDKSVETNHTSPVVMTTAANHTMLITTPQTATASTQTTNAHAALPWVNKPTTTSQSAGTTTAVTTNSGDPVAATDNDTTMTGTTDPTTPTTDPTTTTTSPTTGTTGGDTGSSNGGDNGTGITSTGTGSSDPVPTIPVTVPSVNLGLGGQSVVSTDSMTVIL